MACIREYMHYPAQEQLVGSSNNEACPIDENGWTYEVRTWECSDPENCSSTEEHWQPYKESDKESDDYLSDEDHIQEDSDQSDDHSSEENDDMSESESENYSDEEDPIQEDSNESEEDHSCEENDDILDSESENYSDEDYCYELYDSDGSY
jgi:hypothetical protein